MNEVPIEAIYSGRRVAVTGHTGFTGGWLCTWLTMIGAKVYGFSLPAPTETNLYGALNLGDRINSTIGDIRDAAAVERFFAAAKPEIVFHLAAQPIVSAGFSDPRGTFDINVMGTLNVLESARNCTSARAVVCVTTDKVYRNNEWAWGYREIDALGGTDPYSASKSAAEMVVYTYQKALAPRGNRVLIAAARGGNIIGGGDWADDRIVPDIVRARLAGTPLVLRNPSATRPWQHVLALSHGYLALGERLLGGDDTVAGAYNFGPADESERSVGDLVNQASAHWPGPKPSIGNQQFAESHFLHLSSEKARKELGWQPPLDFDATVEWTMNWYRSFYDGVDPRQLTEGQINAYRTMIGR